MRGQRHAAAALCPGKDRVPTVQEAGWAPGQVRKISPHRDSIPGPSSPYPVAIPTELRGPQERERERKREREREREREFNILKPYFLV